MKLSRLYIDRAVVHYPETRRIREQLQIPEEVVEEPAALFDLLSAAEDSAGAGKRVLLLTVNKGAFVKPCPGTRYYRCCGYQILNIARYCDMDCAYCILQSYFHPPVLQFYVNHEQMEQELERRLQDADRILRLGTGEFTDSLIWEDFTDLTPRLISRFARQQSAILELKTKTVAIDHLHNLVHNRKTILAWSLNTDRVIAEEERKTTTIKQRLEGASRCESWGYPLAFHFDPLIIYDGCETDYQQTVDRLFTAVSADNVVWISLGAFRFMPDLKSVIQKRFSGSRIIYGEFVPGRDKKMRYFKPLRIALYRAVIKRIRKWAPDVTIYFCMEDDEVWEKCLGFPPGKRGGLPRLLDESAVKHCDLDAQLL